MYLIRVMASVYYIVRPDGSLLPGPLSLETAQRWVGRLNAALNRKQQLELEREFEIERQNWIKRQFELQQQLNASCEQEKIESESDFGPGM